MTRLTLRSLSSTLALLTMAAVGLVACESGDGGNHTATVAQAGSGGVGGVGGAAGTAGAGGGAGTGGTAIASCEVDKAYDCGAGEIPPGRVATKICYKSEGPLYGPCAEGPGQICPLNDVPYACVTQAGEAGFLACSMGISASDMPEAHWYCYPEGACKPGDKFECGGAAGLTVSCSVQDGTWGYDPSGCNTPLVLSFDESPVVFTHAAGVFDMNGVASQDTDWVSATQPWLALDLDDNGKIDDGSELFGSMTRVKNRRASHGFEALSALDSNHDGWISADDLLFDKLVLWSDRDQNRASSSSELTSLSASGVVAIELTFSRSVRCSANACERERASFYYVDTLGRSRRGAVIDVHFSQR